MYARLTGTGSCLPGNPVSNDDLVLRGIDTSDEWVVSRTGIRSRFLAAPGTTSSELGLVAAQRALEMAGIAASDIDLIIVATSTPDFIFPSTACLIQGRLRPYCCVRRPGRLQRFCLRSGDRRKVHPLGQQQQGAGDRRRGVFADS